MGRTGIVHNKGIGGQNSAQGRARFEADVIAWRPDVVLIYFGINDALNEPRFIPCDRFIDNLGWMVSRAREAGIRPVLCTIQHVNVDRLFERHRPASYGAEGPNGKIDRYNRALQHLAGERAVALADFADVFDRAGGPTAAHCPDGVHLTAPGYALLADCLFRAAQPLHGDETIICLGDSITAGVNVASPESTYPAVLQRLLAETPAQGGPSSGGIASGMA